MQRLLVFKLGPREYALRAISVEGVSPPRALRGVPRAPRPVLGLSDWRGRLLTVVDLPRLLGDAAAEGSECLVRLAPPHEQIALRIPATIRIVGRDADSEQAAGQQDPWTLLDPTELLQRIDRERREHD